MQAWSARPSPASYVRSSLSLEAFHNVGQAVADGVEVRVVDLFRVPHQNYFTASPTLDTMVFTSWRVRFWLHQ